MNVWQLNINPSYDGTIRIYQGNKVIAWLPSLDDSAVRAFEDIVKAHNAYVEGVGNRMINRKRYEALALSLDTLIEHHYEHHQLEKKKELSDGV